MDNTEKIEEIKKIEQKEKIEKKKKLKKKSQLKKDKENYFNYYDDIKAGCHKVVDW